jgi:hypothetical protein
VIVNLNAAVPTSSGLKVRCELDENQSPEGIVIPDAETLTSTSKWNYTIAPSNCQNETFTS